MITRDEYLKALELVKLYRKQCFEDITLSDEVVTSINPESLFRAVATSRLCKALKNSEFFSWSDDYKVKEVALLVNDYGIKEIRKNRAFGGKLRLELESIISRVL